MHDSMIPVRTPRIPLYDGVRATADEYFALPDDDFRYELIDGVILMSPSPMPLHQRVAAELFFQLEQYLRSNPVGVVFPETDIRLTQKLVYRPEMVFVRRENIARITPRIEFAPDLAVEVVSPESRGRDTKTKFHDFEQHGILEYWLADPAEISIRLWRLDHGHYVDVTPTGDTFASSAVPGFTLDLAAVRGSVRSLG